jgi:hypothetical protein
MPANNIADSVKRGSQVGGMARLLQVLFSL